MLSARQDHAAVRGVDCNIPARHCLLNYGDGVQRGARPKGLGDDQDLTGKATNYE